MKQWLKPRLFACSQQPGYHMRDYLPLCKVVEDRCK